MRIIHLCLANFYIDDFSYQENILPVVNKTDGHTVEIIASTETYSDKRKISYVEPGSYISNENIKITRVPYRRYLPHILMRKIRHYRYVYELIANFSPDVIMFHGLSSYELLTVAKYKQKNPSTKLFVDNHADENNSAKGWFSRNCLHRIFYRSIVRRAYRFIDRVFYISLETKDFLRKFYRLSEEKMEFYPIGGNIFEDSVRNERRRRKRKDLGMQESDILLVHSGKLDPGKRTDDLIKAFLKVDKENMKLAIIGSIPDGQKHLDSLIKRSDRIVYLGWAKSDELLDFLCASDLYAQPGTQSATMQSALCCGSAAMLFPYRSHKHLLGDSVFYVESVDDIVQVLELISENRELLENKRSQSIKLSKDVLDYRKLAMRLYN